MTKHIMFIEHYVDESTDIYSVIVRSNGEPVGGQAKTFWGALKEALREIK